MLSSEYPSYILSSQYIAYAANHLKLQDCLLAANTAHENMESARQILSTPYDAQMLADAQSLVAKATIQIKFANDVTDAKIHHLGGDPDQCALKVKEIAVQVQAIANSLCLDPIQDLTEARRRYDEYVKDSLTTALAEEEAQINQICQYFREPPLTDRVSDEKWDHAIALALAAKNQVVLWRIVQNLTS